MGLHLLRIGFFSLEIFFFSFFVLCNLSTSIYDLVLIYVCHFHNHHPTFWQFRYLLTIRYSCLHPRIIFFNVSSSLSLHSVGSSNLGQRQVSKNSKFHLQKANTLGKCLRKYQKPNLYYW